MKTSIFYHIQAGGIIHSISFIVLLSGRIKVCTRHFARRANLARFTHEIFEYGIKEIQ